MRIINSYTGPSVDDLINLKDRLSKSGAEMADLALVSGDSQWRKYTNRNNPRELSPHMLFYIAAQLSLTGDELSKVLAKMREIGSSFTDS